MIFPNEPAFPVKDISDGLTIRQHMAIKFMAAYIQSYSAGSLPAFELAKYSVDSADALIAELNKTA